MYIDDSPDYSPYAQLTIREPLRCFTITLVALGAIGLIAWGICIHLNLLVMSPMLAIGLEAAGGIILGILAVYLSGGRSAKNNQLQNIDDETNDEFSDSYSDSLEYNNVKSDEFSDSHKGSIEYREFQVKNISNTEEIACLIADGEILSLKIHLNDNMGTSVLPDDFFDKFPHVEQVEFLSSPSKIALYTLPICKGICEKGFVLDFPSSSCKLISISKDEISNYMKEGREVFEKIGDGYFIEEGYSKAIYFKGESKSSTDIKI